MTMIKYVIEKSDMGDRSQFYHWVHHHLSPPLEAQTMTLAEQLRTEGIQQGIQQGQLEGEQKLLMTLLQHRLPTLPHDYEIRVKNARAEQLLLWGKKVLDAKSVEEVFES